MTATTTDPMTCPSWCDGPANPTIHNDSSTHVHEVSTGEVATEIYRRVDDGTWAVPVSFLTHADLCFRGNIALEDLTAEDCRSLASILGSAAAELDAINAGVPA